MNKNPVNRATRVPASLREIAPADLRAASADNSVYASRAGAEEVGMLRRGIALAITAGSLVLTSSQPSATRVVGQRGDGEDHRRRRSTPRHPRSSTSRRTRFDFARPGYHHQDQQRDDRGRPQGRRRRHHHRRPRRADRQERRRDAGLHLGQLRDRLVRREQARLHVLSTRTRTGNAGTVSRPPPTRAASSRTSTSAITPTPSGHPPGELRQDQDPHDRRLRHAHDARRLSRASAARPTTPTSSSTSGPTVWRFPTNGTRSDSQRLQPVP